MAGAVATAAAAVVGAAVRAVVVVAVARTVAAGAAAAGGSKTKLQPKQGGAALGHATAVPPVLCAGGAGLPTTTLVDATGLRRWIAALPRCVASVIRHRGFCLGTEA